MAGNFYAVSVNRKRIINAKDEFGRFPNRNQAWIAVRVHAAICFAGNSTRWHEVQKIIQAIMDAPEHVADDFLELQGVDDQPLRYIVTRT